MAAALCYTLARWMHRCMLGFLRLVFCWQPTDSVKLCLRRFSDLPALPCPLLCCFSLQERADELAAHEESLETWKAQFKAEAVRQIAERERLLTEWQARLDRRAAEVEDAQRAAEVRGLAGVLMQCRVQRAQCEQLL